MQAHVQVRLPGQRIHSGMIPGRAPCRQSCLRDTCLKITRDRRRRVLPVGAATLSLLCTHLSQQDILVHRRIVLGRHLRQATLRRLMRPVSRHSLPPHRRRLPHRNTRRIPLTILRLLAQYLISLIDSLHRHLFFVQSTQMKSPVFVN